MPTLIFVYNADSGLFNTLADIGHKLLSPDTYRCDLCMLTHGVFTEREQWRAFVESLPLPCRFLHRDEFRREFPEVNADLPAVFLLQHDQLHLCLPSDRLAQCENLGQLQQWIDDVIKHIH